MGIDVNNLPDHFLSKLPLEERKKLGRAGMTSEEAQAKYVAGKERELQGDISAWLMRERHYFVRPRMDKKSTLRVGTPDFIVCVRDREGRGRFLCLEAKAGMAKLTPEQEIVMGEAIRSGATYCVVRKLEEVIVAVHALESL